ncbi:hypothetical protein SAMN05216464_1102 [Mucilaginibacter pineti]|uniref:Uncharacterized protein n=1 Tax=Mucilaginibacter pineti TaxID=1391627 RepID=A0A1G7G745_9SPHI|nr:hypothetical protein [Mucilaginibacter pineti]SDE83958.1 hypothetical protein SAMN05216464_1102 [Mucilaginibacter pineti]
MKPTDELTGTSVLVHPDFDDDPAQKQGQVGMITGAKLETDDIYVSFGKGENARYSTNALLVFKPADVIYELLMNEARKANYDDFKALFQVNLMQQHGLTPLVRKAMEFVKDNKVVREFAMDTLENQLEINQNRGYEY